MITIVVMNIYLIQYCAQLSFFNKIINAFFFKQMNLEHGPMQ